MTNPIGSDPKPDRGKKKNFLWLFIGIGCLSALSLLFLPWFFFSRGGPRGESSQVAACRANLKNVATALEMYSTDNQGAYPASLSQLTPNYLKVLPDCPAAGAQTYLESYQVATHPDNFTLFCSGHHHEAAGMGPDHPLYNSIEGMRD